MGLKSLFTQDRPRLSGRVARLSEIGPKGVSFHHGVSLENLQRFNVMADSDDLTKLLPVEAEEIFDRMWEEGDYGLIQEPKLALEVFCFAAVFGEPAAAWLLRECTTKAIDKSYVMREPDQDLMLDDLVLSSIGHSLSAFRLLVAAYIGWLGRASTVSASGTTSETQIIQGPA